jgi:GNAT superfamily N-acetyltransferase
MEIQRITTQDVFAELVGWNALDAYRFGPLGNLPADADDGDDADEDDVVLVATVDGAAVGYLTADRHGVWCVEVRAEARGNGIARALVAESGADAFCEVCSADGLALANALGMEIDEA